jgi:sugar-specific transcriptional regulator TrmB
LSQEKILKTLENFGLTRPDAQIYVFLGKRGPQRAIDIAKSLRLPRQTLYRAIKHLQSKGIITASISHPAKFGAVPFERVLDLFAKAKAEEVHRIEQDKTSLLSDWCSIAITEVADQSPKFTVIEGRNFIYPRLKQMVETTKRQISIVSTISGLAQADQFGLLDAALNQASRTNAKFRFLTELTDENLKEMKLFLERIPKDGSFEGRTPELGLKLISRMLIKDDEEAAFFVNQEVDKTPKNVDDICLWTNSNTIVNSFKVVFEDLWQNSAEIGQRLSELETGKPAARTYNIGDPEAAKKKFDDIVNSAEREIIMITSSNGLVEVWNNISQLMKTAKKGVSVKIMAPIIKDNLEAALLLSGCCSVKHVATSYLETTIIDNRHLFQFKQSPGERGKKDYPTQFENTFYTNESGYVEKTKRLLEEIWQHSIAPSALTLEQITKPSMPATPPVPDDELTVSRKDSPYQRGLYGGVKERPTEVTQESIQNRILNAKRVPAKYPWKDPIYQYGGGGSAVIHPPSSLNLPDTLLSFSHYTKKSSSELEDSFYVSLLLDTPKGKLYVPVACVLDNPEGVERRKIFFAGTPAGENIHLLKKNEIEIQFFGNTMFAGWTVPIPLFPPPYVLPPGGVLIEGYGKAKSNILEQTMPSGARIVTEVCGQDAFVTFFHPASKYAGPGTDGIVGGDMIQTIYPPPTPKSDKQSNQKTPDNR